MDNTLFELPPRNPFPITLRADSPTRNYLRERMGQPNKVTLRSPERGNRIVATVYTGEDDARWIVEAVNAYGKREVR